MNINRLTLYSNNIAEQKAFYSDVLDFLVIETTENSIDISIGDSTLCFIQSDHATPYHFAINIPSNKEHEALDWLKQRLEILCYENDELIDFPNWNAKAMYFYDADKNIVEFIARKNLNINTSSPFSAEQCIEISEIGLSVINIEETYGSLNAIKPLPVYFGSFDMFCAAGDERGLFIIIDKHKKLWFPSNDVAHTSDFSIEGDYNFRFIKGKVLPY